VAADKVRAILEAAEQSAAELRAEAAQEIEIQLARAEAAAERLSARAAELERSLDALANGVRDELSALRADLAELSAVAERVGAVRTDAAEAAAEEPATEVVEEPATEVVEEPATEVVEEPGAEEPGAEEPESEPASPARPPAPSGDGHEGARVIALNMALNGSSREDTARYLSENFELEDPEALLDEVYDRASG
jgi:hypothetical protein